MSTFDRTAVSTFERVAIDLTHRAFPAMASAIHARSDRIIKLWCGLALEAMPHLDALTQEEFEDTITEILSAAADALYSADPQCLLGVIDSGPQHGIDRFVQKYSLLDLFEEVRILRGVVIVEIADEMCRPLEVDEAATFHAIFDIIIQQGVMALVHAHDMQVQQTQAATIEMNEQLLISSVHQHELTEQANNAEEALRDSEQRFRTLFELGPVAVYSCDDSGVIQLFNRRAAELWGRAPALGDSDERFCGSFRMIRPDGSVMAHEQCPMAEVLSGKISYVRDAEVRIDRPDGSRITVLVNIGPLKNERGEITGAINCFYDITERKKSEKQLRLAKQEADEANQAKDMFLATLSHEVRTPLSAIIGWMQILQGGMEGGCTEAELNEGLEVIERNARSMVVLLDDVMDMSRIISGKVRMEVRPCELSEVIRAGIDVVSPAAKAKDITLIAELDPAGSAASCDAARMQQVIWNLLSNAIKFTPKGGKVRLTLARDGADVRIQVTDSGQGIDRELLPYVFDRFRQADSSTRRRFGGLGLGLSIVKHLVELHGGTVGAESAGEGLGSTFSVRLPIRAVRTDESRNDPDADEFGLPSTTGLPVLRLDALRVLVADDDPDARRLLVKVLQEAGAVVTAAASAAEAVAAIAESNPEVLISDLGMPDQDGFDLIRQIRALGHHAKDLPAVALSAFVHKSDQRKALLAGFQTHVAKPADPHDLTVVIARLAGRAGPDL